MKLEDVQSYACKYFGFDSFVVYISDGWGSYSIQAVCDVIVVRICVLLLQSFYFSNINVHLCNVFHLSDGRFLFLLD